MTLQLVAHTSAPNEDAIALVEGLLERLRSGESVAVAFVEVFRNRSVATAWCESESYHLLNSGAAGLAARLAMDGIE
jgi:hypothetical protein